MFFLYLIVPGLINTIHMNMWYNLSLPLCLQLQNISFVDVLSLKPVLLKRSACQGGEEGTGQSKQWSIPFFYYIQLDFLLSKYKEANLYSNRLRRQLKSYLYPSRSFSINLKMLKNRHKLKCKRLLKHKEHSSYI